MTIVGRKDGFAVSISEQINICLFFKECSSNRQKLIKIKEFNFKYELDDLWKVITGKKLFDNLNLNKSK